MLKVANRELFRLDNLCKPTSQRCAEPALYAEADAFHASPAFIDEATNIQMGTRYLQALIDRARREKRADPIVEAYMPASKMRASGPLWSRWLLALWCRVCRLPPAQKLRSNFSVWRRAARMAKILRKI